MHTAFCSSPVPADARRRLNPTARSLRRQPAEWHGCLARPGIWPMRCHPRKCRRRKYAGSARALIAACARLRHCRRSDKTRVRGFPLRRSCGNVPPRHASRAVARQTSRRGHNGWHCCLPARETASIAAHRGVGHPQNHRPLRWHPGCRAKVRAGRPGCQCVPASAKCFANARRATKTVAGRRAIGAEYLSSCVAIH